MRWHDRIMRGVDYLSRELGPHGQWPGMVFQDGITDAGKKDIAPPLTALGVLALRGLPLNGADDLVRRSLVHIERTVRPGGLWRYYANIPTDTDDSALCALALGRQHPLVHGRTSSALVARQLPDGRFPTWFEPGWEPVVDAVANAHAVALIGPGPETEAAVAWLMDVVASGREAVSSTYYPDPLDLHMALTRAMEAGVEALKPAGDIAAEKALHRLQAGDLTPYRIAQAIVVAGSASRHSAPALTAAAAHLAAHAELGGCWPADTLFVAGRSEREGFFLYQSQAVVTALCLRALVVAAGWESD